MPLSPGRGVALTPGNNGWYNQIWAYHFRQVALPLRPDIQKKSPFPLAVKTDLNYLLLAIQVMTGLARKVLSNAPSACF